MSHLNFILSQWRFRILLPLFMGMLIIFSAPKTHGQPETVSANFYCNSSFTGEAGYDVAGWDVAFLGDVNNDGFEDLLIGAPKNSEGGLEAGAAYLIFGAETMAPLLTSLTKADVIFIGTKSKDEAGMKVAGIGDVNGDDFSDFIISAPMKDNGSGKVYLFFGNSSDWPAEVKLSDADVIFAGEKWGDNAGFAVVAAGDVNSDSLSDMIINAPGSDCKGNDTGKAYLILGKKEGWSKNISLADADVIFEGETLRDKFGTSVAGIGDVNQDEIDDIAIGAPFYNNDGIKNVGKVYIFFGKESFDAKVDGNAADASFIGKETNDLFGKFISNGGDVNGDGIEDFSITASLENDAGKIYLILGKTTGWVQNEIPETTAPSFIGEKIGDCAGVPILISDLSGDGFYDLIIGASKNSEADSQAGKIYFVEGKSGEWNQNISLANAEIVMQGENAHDFAGHALAAGDFDGDGYQDVAVGAPGSDTSSVDAGIVYLFHDQFELMPVSLTLTAPNGVENWLVGSEQQISWTSEGNIENVTLKYSTDNGVNWKLIIENTPNDGEYKWTIPDDTSTTCLVSVEDATDGDPIDTSDQAFKISAPILDEIILIAPNGGECWLAETEQEIKWISQGSIQQVNLDYSIDGGQNWISIIHAAPNDSSYLWKVPQVHSKDCLIKIADIDGSAKDTCDAVFTIWGEAPITILSPNGGECLHADQEFEITWEACCNLDSIKIQYSIDGGEQWKTIVDGTENDGNYLWEVPKLHSDSCLIKLADLDCDPEDVSDSLFTIWGKAPVTVISPNGGECLKPGQKIKINWEACNCLDSVKIQYSINNGEDWETIVKSTPNDSSFLWTVPAIHSANCLVKVADLDCDPEDISDQTFTIWNKMPITVLSPNGGECLPADQEYEINWEASCSLDSMKIQYSVDGGENWTTIINGTENDGSYLWTVPKLHSDSCLIKVADLDCDPEDVSDSLFTIWGKAPVTVLYPNGGECLKPGQEVKIKWEACCCLDSMKIQYSTDGGDDWTSIVYGTENDGSFLWTVPDVHSDNCLIKVADMDCDPEDFSDKPFTIWGKAPITVISPNGGECLDPGQQFEIKWEAICSLDSVKIQYSTDGGNDWTMIVKSTPNDSCYTWTVPEVHSTNCLIKVADLDCDPEDISDKPFSIWNKAPVTVLSPNGGECLNAEQQFEIKWEASTKFDSLKIQYSIDGGKDWETIIYGTENDGKYLWTVPKVHSDSCLIKVADLDCDPYDVSDSLFTIWGKAPVTVVYPNGGECLKPNQKIEIKWEAYSSLDSMKIQFSTDGGNDWTNIIYGTENDGSFFWTIPYVHSNNCLIKVADLDCDPEDISNQTFTIWGKAPITVISPNGNECLKAGDPFKIKWEATCNLDLLKLQYSIDGGKEWAAIVNSTENDSCFTWIVPEVNSDSCLIKVADLDCEPADVSDSLFAICAPPFVTVLQPNGGDTLRAGQAYEIKWYACCFIDTVKIQYSIDGGENWLNVIQRTANDSSYVWQVPGTLSDSCLIKVADIDCDPHDVSDSLFMIVSAPLAEFDATVMTGSDPLEVKFINLSTGYVNRWKWNFGDGTTSEAKEPTHCYDKPGTYSVKLMAFYSTGIDSIIKTNFIQVHQKETFAQLDVINSTPTLPESDCSNAIDGDLYGWDGTTVLKGKQPSIIFSLADSANKNISSIGLLTDTGIGYEDRWIRHFQVQISNSYLEPGNFQTVLDTAMTTGELEVFSIQPLQAKYVKLVIVAPQTNYVHLGEFQVFYSEGTTGTVLAEETAIPDAFRLAQNYPNPFNPETYIKYAIPKEGNVTIEIYDVRGRLVRKLVDEHKPAGCYLVTWDARNDYGVRVSTGIYLVRMKSRTFTSIKKMTLLK